MIRLQPPYRRLLYQDSLLCCRGLLGLLQKNTVNIIRKRNTQAAQHCSKLSWYPLSTGVA